MSGEIIYLDNMDGRYRAHVDDDEAFKEQERTLLFLSNNDFLLNERYQIKPIPRRDMSLPHGYSKTAPDEIENVSWFDVRWNQEVAHKAHQVNDDVGRFDFRWAQEILNDISNEIDHAPVVAKAKEREIYRVIFDENNHSTRSLMTNSSLVPDGSDRKIKFDCSTDNCKEDLSLLILGLRDQNNHAHFARAFVKRANEMFQNVDSLIAFLLEMFKVRENRELQAIFSLYSQSEELTMFRNWFFAHMHGSIQVIELEEDMVLNHFHRKGYETKTYIEVFNSKPWLWLTNFSSNSIDTLHSRLAVKKKWGLYLYNEGKRPHRRGWLHSLHYNRPRKFPKGTILVKSLTRPFGSKQEANTEQFCFISSLNKNVVTTLEQ